MIFQALFKILFYHENASDSFMCENYFNIDKSALHFFSEIQKQKTERPEKRTPAKGNSFFVCLPTRICVIYSVCVNYICHCCCIIEAFKDQLAQAANDQKFMYTSALKQQM